MKPELTNEFLLFKYECLNFQSRPWKFGIFCDSVIFEVRMTEIWAMVCTHKVMQSYFKFKLNTGIFLLLIYSCNYLTSFVIFQQIFLKFNDKYTEDL